MDADIEGVKLAFAPTKPCTGVPGVAMDGAILELDEDFAGLGAGETDGLATGFVTLVVMALLIGLISTALGAGGVGLVGFGADLATGVEAVLFGLFAGALLTTLVETVFAVALMGTFLAGAGLLFTAVLGLLTFVDAVDLVLFEGFLVDLRGFAAVLAAEALVAFGAAFLAGTGFTEAFTIVFPDFLAATALLAGLAVLLVLAAGRADFIVCLLASSSAFVCDRSGVSWIPSARVIPLLAGFFAVLSVCGAFDPR